MARAEDVPQAVEKSKAGKTDLILMLLDSRTLEGWEAIEVIREANPLLPVIVIAKEPGLRGMAEAAGARALVERPVDITALLQNMREQGLRPMVALHHFTHPQWFHDRGGWLAKKSPELFLAYADQVVRSLGDLCD